MTLSGAASGAAAGASFGPWGAAIGGVLGAIGGSSAKRKQQKAMKRIMDERRAIKANKFKYAKAAHRDTNLDNMATTNALIKGEAGKNVQTGSQSNFLRAAYSQQAGANRASRRDYMKDKMDIEGYEIYSNQDPSQMAAQDGAAMANMLKSIGSIAGAAKGWGGGSTLPAGRQGQTLRGPGWTGGAPAPTYGPYAGGLDTPITYDLGN